MRIVSIAIVLVFSITALARMSVADTEGGKATASSPRSGTQEDQAATKGIPPCGPEVAAVLGGEDDTACLPHDIGRHGRATVPRGVTGPSSAKRPEH